MTARSSLLLSVLLLAGCGGKYHGSAATTVGSPFSGAFSGNYAETEPTPNAVTGTLTLIIASDGTITGGTTSTQFPDITGTISSSGISSSGQTTLSVAYVQNGVSNSTTLAGPLRLANGVLSGTLSTNAGGAATTFTLSLSPIVG